MATPHVPTMYTLLTLPAARRQLLRLQKTRDPNTEHIIAGILSLAENPRPSRARKLVNRAEMRLRIGDYRVLYSVDDVHRTVTISVIAHRREVYR
jgi:mRNA interferase RelE/StbE